MDNNFFIKAKPLISIEAITQANGTFDMGAVISVNALQSSFTTQFNISLKKAHIVSDVQNKLIKQKNFASFFFKIAITFNIAVIIVIKPNTIHFIHLVLSLNLQ